MRFNGFWTLYIIRTGDKGLTKNAQVACTLACSSTRKIHTFYLYSPVTLKCRVWMSRLLFVLVERGERDPFWCSYQFGIVGATRDNDDDCHWALKTQGLNDKGPLQRNFEIKVKLLKSTEIPDHLGYRLDFVYSFNSTEGEGASFRERERNEDEDISCKR